ncbi:hypothetical protein STEG23_030846 [Scotinomys teguina]
MDAHKNQCATTLFDIWTKYAPRLPSDYYKEKLLKVGDSLCQLKEYRLALLQCYGRYLQQFTANFDEHREDVNQFKTVFFPKGFGDKTAGLTFQALSGKNICSYQLVCDSDANLQNEESVSRCLHILSSLRLITQVALPQEHLCWIIFNEGEGGGGEREEEEKRRRRNRRGGGEIEEEEERRGGRREREEEEEEEKREEEEEEEEEEGGGGERNREEEEEEEERRREEEEEEEEEEERGGGEREEREEEERGRRRRRRRREEEERRRKEEEEEEERRRRRGRGGEEKEEEEKEEKRRKRRRGGEEEEKRRKRERRKRREAAAADFQNVRVHKDSARVSSCTIYLACGFCLWELALEYLLWASVCMESSVPLLSIRYLTWRTTLYTAVCQCHYDCRAGIQGEAFARRALAKIDELRQLELMSSSECQEGSRRCYREATIKMAVMIFKRGVYESRRKSKLVFRPKIRINLKEAQSMIWPRTVTERLLDELFDSTSSRFLAVLEALFDSGRRILQTGPLVTDEVELRDVVSELFLAGKELLMISNVGANGKLDFPQTHLLDHIVERKNIISLRAAIKFTKLAFTYEEWGLFESLAGQLIYFLKKQDSLELKKAEKDLILLVAVEPLINLKKNKGSIFPLDNDKEGQSIHVYLKHIACHQSCVRSTVYSEDIFHLAAILHFCVCVPSQGVQPDKDIVVDIVTFLWQKCKFGIQRLNLSRSDFAKYSHRISTNKWVYLLWQISEVIHCYQLEEWDAVMVAEITLRLTEILESLGSPKRKFSKSSELSSKRGPEEFSETPKGIPEVLPILKAAASVLLSS